MIQQLALQRIPPLGSGSSQIGINEDRSDDQPESRDRPSYGFTRASGEEIAAEADS